jgi:hypothetical protein|nr:hypothetical protein [uncultured Mediterranean phage uvMED]
MGTSIMILNFNTLLKNYRKENMKINLKELEHIKYSLLQSKKNVSYTYEVSCELRDLYKKISSYYDEEQKKVKIELIVVDSKKL